MNVVIFTQRSNDWHAHLQGNPGVWGCGASRKLALGDLIMSHPEFFDITLLFS